MGYKKTYSRTNYKNFPNTTTPLNETNLNKLDLAVDTIDDRVITLESTKASQSDMLNTVKSVELLSDNSTIRVTHTNGAIEDYATGLSQVIVNFEFDRAAESLVLTLEDGTKEYISLAAFITNVSFGSSDTIDVKTTEDLEFHVGTQASKEILLSNECAVEAISGDDNEITVSYSGTKLNGTGTNILNITFEFLNAGGGMASIVMTQLLSSQKSTTTKIYNDEFSYVRIIISDIAKFGITLEDIPDFEFKLNNQDIKQLVILEVKKGSITGDHLEPNYLANCQLAEQHAKASEDNAKVSETNAKTYADEAKETVTDIEFIDSADVVFANVDGSQKKVTATTPTINNNLSDLKVGETHGGANLWDEKLEKGDYLAGNYQKIDNSSTYRTVNLIKVKPNTSYYFASDVDVYIHGYKADKYTAIGVDGSTYYKLISKNTSYTTPSECEYLVFAIVDSSSNHNIAIIEGTSGTYEPYIPSVRMLSNAEEQIKWLGWTIPSEFAIQEPSKVGRIDLGSLSWVKLSSGEFYADKITYIKVCATYDDLANIFTSKYTTASVNNLLNSTMDKIIAFGIDPYRQILIRDTSYSDANAFKSAMQGQYLYYELSTPRTLSDGAEITTQINESLSEQGLDLKRIELFQGCTDSTSSKPFSPTPSKQWVTHKEPLIVKENDNITFKYVGKITTKQYVFFYKSDLSIISYVELSNGTTTDVTVKAPKNTYYAQVVIGNTSSTLLLSEVSKFDLYINNAIDEIKKDLSNFVKILEFSGTTDSHGYFDIPLKLNQGKLVIGGTFNQGYAFSCFCSAGADWYVVAEDGNGERATNVSLTGTVYYVEV